MASNIIVDKSFDFAIKIVNLYRFLVNVQLNKKLLRGFLKN